MADNPTADEITAHMVACGHAVIQIDGIKAGTDYYSAANGHSQQEINDCVDRSIGHLKVQAAKQWYKDDSVSRSGNDTKAKHTAAIKTGEDYIAANPE